MHKETSRGGGIEGRWFKGTHFRYKINTRDIMYTTITIVNTAVWYKGTLSRE